MRRSILFSCLCLVMTLLVSGPSPAMEGADKTLTVEHAVAEGDSLSVENLLGSVRVVPAKSPGSIRVEAWIVAEAKTAEEARALVESIRLDARGNGQETRVHVGFPVERFQSFRPPKAGAKGMIQRWTASIRRDSSTVDYDGSTVKVGSDRKAAGLAVHLTVTLPHGLSASIRQSVGSIEVRALRGQLRLETVDGDIDFKRGYGSLQAQSQSGEIRVSSFQGEQLDVTTEDGNMELSEVRADSIRLRTDTGAIRGTRVTGGKLIVDSASGDVKLAAVEPRTAEVTTESGKVDLATHLKHTRDAVIRSANGNVTLRVGTLTHFDLRAESKSGTVKTLGDVTLAVMNQDGRTTQLQHGKGGVDLRVSAPEGSVTVRPFDGSRLDLLLGN